MGTGTAASLLLLIKYLGQDFDVAVVSDRHSKMLPDALAKLQAPHYGLRDRAILYLPSLIWTILRGKFDLIYGNGSNQRSRGAYWATRLTRRPFIWHVRESLRGRKYDRTIRFADAVIANSQDTAERIRKFTNFPDPIVVKNGVDIQLFERDKQVAKDILGADLGLNHDWARVINLGRICRDKNQMEVVEIAAQVVKTFPETYFIIVGNIFELDYLAQIKYAIEQKDLKRNVILHDYTSKVSDFLCGCDLMIHTSTKESQGRVILEAMAARLPVVAYQVGGVSEAVIAGKTAFLLPFGDRDGLVKAVRKLLGDSYTREQMSEGGYRHVKSNYSAETTAQAVREIISQVLLK